MPLASPHTRFHSLEIANKGESLAWTADGIRLPAQHNDHLVWQRFMVACPKRKATDFPHDA
jgi:hypothetical protein